MPPVEELLKKELERLSARQEAVQQEIDDLPRGYVSKKAIKGRDYFYLQHREGQSVKSQLIKQGALESILEKLQQKQQLKQELREIKKERKQIERLLKAEQRRMLFGSMKKNTI